MAECSYTYKTPEGEEKEFKDLEALHKYLLSDKVSKDAITSQLKSESHATAKSEGPLEEGHQQAGVEEHTRTGTPRDEEKEPQTSGGDRDQDGKGREQKEEKVTPEWTGITKEKALDEIKGIKDIWDKEGRQKWTDIQQEALEAVMRDHPGKTLYEATRMRVEELASMYDLGIKYNPTSRDLAVIQEFKRATEQNIKDAGPDLSSPNQGNRQWAMMGIDAYNNDLVKVGKALFTKEAGTAFGFRQSESKMNPDYGLQIRRMQIMRAKGGDNLTPGEESWVKDQWQKEKDLQKEEQNLREKAMREEFDVKLEKLKKDFDEKLKKASAEKRPRTEKEKTLSQKGKEVADKIRKFKMPKGSTKMDFTLGGYDLAVEGVAKLVEAGAEIGEAIKKLIDDGTIGFKTDKDKEMFEDSLVGAVGRGDQKENALKGIQKLAGDTPSKITTDMVAKNHIRDFVNSFVGVSDTKDVLDDALSELKQTLPDANKQQLIDAYLKENDYKQPTKKQLEGSIAESKKELTKIAKAESDFREGEKLAKQTAKLNAKQQKLAALSAIPEYEKELNRQKENALRAIKSFQKKIDTGDFSEPEQKIFTKADADLIQLNKMKADVENEYRKKQNEIKEANRGWFQRLVDFTRTGYVLALIGGVPSFVKVATASITRPALEFLTKSTAGKAFDLMAPNISKAAKGGGESTSWQSRAKGIEAILRNRGREWFEQKSIKLENEYQKAQAAYDDYAKSTSPKPKELERLKKEADQKMFAATSNVIYQFIGGSSLRDAAQSFINRANKIEEQFGAINKEGIDMDELWHHPMEAVKALKRNNPMDSMLYVLGFIGRSHSAMKTFSGRAFFASGFMARLEYAHEHGVDIRNPDRLLEIAHESYLDWERGKWQQDNYITNKWNRILGAIDSKNKDNPDWDKFNAFASSLVKSDVAITRVPVNMAHEVLYEYTAGAFASLIKARIEVSKARKEALRDFTGTVNSPEFKQKVKDIIAGMDTKQAATIARLFRKGTIGMGFYGLALMSAAVAFGGYPHLGQRKSKNEEDLDDDELNPGQVQIGNVKFNKTESEMISHVPGFYPTFLGTGMAYEIDNNLRKQAKKGDEDLTKATIDAAFTQLQTMEGMIPQFKALGGGPAEVGKQMYKIGEKRLQDWGLLDDGTDGGTNKVEW